MDMKYFKELTELPTLDLWNEFNQLLDNNVISWHPHERDQICLNTILGEESSIHFGRGSLQYDWDNAYEDDSGKLIVPERKAKLSESDFTVLCEQFKNTLFEEVYTALSSKFLLGRVRIMNLKPKTCLSWHVDSHPRVHYPLKTQQGCMMIIEDELQVLEQGKWYHTNTVYSHTAINSSKEERYHLVATVIEVLDA